MKIAIASGKGGTGKTTLSTNLASFLAEKQDVVLVDLDVEEPNAALFVKGDEVEQKEMFKKVPKWDSDACTLCGKCQEVCNFNAVLKLGDEVMVLQELCHACYACSELCPSSALPMVPVRMGKLQYSKKDNLSMVESRLDIGQEQAVPLISQTIDYVDSKFDKDTIKLFDSPPGTSCPVIEATKDADYIVLVTEPTPFGLHDLTIAVKTMRLMGKRFGVVVNRDGIGNSGLIDYCEKEGIDVLARIPNDRRIAELYSHGELLYPHISEFREQLEVLATKLSEVKKDVQ